MWSSLRQDVIYALRAMRRAPAFTGIAVFTLAAGIGVNTAMFSVVNAVLLRPLPYAEADDLLALWNRWPGTERGVLSDPELLDFRERARTADVAGFAGGSGNLTGRGDPARLVFTAVTANALEVLGVAPAIGRTFRPEEELPANNAVAILTDGLRRRLFNASPDVLGRTLMIDGQPVTVIGVLPPGFVVPYEFEGIERSTYLGPLPSDPGAPRTSRGNHYMAAVARPRPGYTPEQVSAEIKRHRARFRCRVPERLRAELRSVGDPAARRGRRRHARRAADPPRGRRPLCCRSRARTSPTCCSPGLKCACARWPFARQSAPRRRAWRARFSGSRSSSRVWPRSSGCCSPAPWFPSPQQRRP